MRLAWLLALPLVGGCADDLGIEQAHFACSSNADCTEGRICDALLGQCALHGCGDGVVDRGEECDAVPASPGCRKCKLAFGWRCTGASCSGPLFSDFAAGERHACGVLLDGTLACEGSNLDRLGDVVGQASPPPGSFKRVAAAIVHSCAIDASDRVVCWGADERIFANGDHFPSREKSEAPAGAYVELAAGGYHACALTVSSTVAVRCWGAERYRQSYPGGAAVVASSAISAGYEHSCAIGKSDGAIYCWGEFMRPGYEAIVMPPPVSATSLGAGWYQTCAVSAGALSCWGLAHSPILEPPAGADFASVACGHFHCCALHADGRPACWGKDGAEGLDMASLAPDEPFARVFAGAQYACGLRADGTVSCWGDVFGWTLDE